MINLLSLINLRRSSNTIGLRVTGTGLRLLFRPLLMSDEIVLQSFSQNYFLRLSRLLLHLSCRPSRLLHTFEWYPYQLFALSRPPKSLKHQSYCAKLSRIPNKLHLHLCSKYELDSEIIHRQQYPKCAVLLRVSLGC